jgi:hypothetical protein
MDPNLRALVAAAESSGWTEDDPAPAARSRLAVELGRRGLFLRLGRVEAYACFEPDAAWAFWREPGGFDAQAGRLHLIVGRAPE